MKTLLFIFLFFFSINGALSQFSVPFPTDSARWVHEYVVYFQGFPPTYYKGGFKTFGDDTLIAGQNYTKLYNIYYNQDYKGGMREANNKVFFYPDQDTAEYLMYDFNLVAGDTVQDVYFWNGSEVYNSGNFFGPTVIYTDTVNYNNLDRKRIVLTDNFSWIEGIGASTGLFAQFTPELGSTGQLLCVSENQTTFYPSLVNNICYEFLELKSLENISYQLYPNPSNGEFDLQSENLPGQTKIKIVDITGNEVKTILYDSHQTKINLDVSPGVYLMTLPDLPETKVARIVIQ